MIDLTADVVFHGYLAARELVAKVCEGRKCGSQSRLARSIALDGHLLSPPSHTISRHGEHDTNGLKAVNVSVWPEFTSGDVMAGWGGYDGRCWRKGYRIGCRA